jgi:hypothetical protein
VNFASRSQGQGPERGDPPAEIHHQVAGSLDSPGRGRVGGHPEDMHPSTVDLDHEQHVQPAQGDGVQAEEINGQQAGCLGAQEGPPTGVGPAWRRTDPGATEDPADRGGADPVAESEEFSLDAAMTPGRVLLGQSDDEGADLHLDRRTPRRAGIGPSLGDQAAVPSQQGGRGEAPVCPQTAGQQPAQG